MLAYELIFLPGLPTSEETITSIPVTGCILYNFTSTSCNDVCEGEICYTLRIETQNVDRRTITKKHKRSADFGGILQQILKVQIEEIN